MDVNALLYIYISSLLIEMLEMLCHWCNIDSSSHRLAARLSDMITVYVVTSLCGSVQVDG